MAWICIALLVVNVAVLHLKVVRLRAEVDALWADSAACILDLQKLYEKRQP